MRILFITTVGGTTCFFKYLIKTLLEHNIMVDIASNTSVSPVPEEYRKWGCQIFMLSCTRAPKDKNNLTAIKEIKKIVTQNYYDIIHCHTPIAAVCTRIACRKARKQGSRVFYTAHGFHFHKGAPLENWLLYYPIERICAYWTDVLITINRQDFFLAKKKMKAQSITYVPGVGIDIEKFAKISIHKTAKRLELHVPENAFLLLSIGELNDNKNHETVIRALSELHDPKIHYIIAGSGYLDGYLENLAAELGIKKQIHILGYRKDVNELYKVSDAYIHPSLREGLPVTIMEAMAAKIPVICSDIRGCQELIDKEYLFCPKDTTDVIRKIRKIISSKDVADVIAANYSKLKKYDNYHVTKKMLKLYGIKEV